MSRKAAIIDIGSNTVRLGLCQYKQDQDGGYFCCPEGKQLRTVRLGQGLIETGCLQPASMERAIAAVCEFYAMAAGRGFPVYAYATSAVRDAANRHIFMERLAAVCPVTVEVLSGHDEGRLAYLGAGGRGTLLDIGGGSAQIVTDTFSVSRPTGCVRAKDLCPNGTPEELRASLFPWLQKNWEPFPAVQEPFYGVGGTITTLGAFMAGQTRFDGQALSALTPASLRALLQRLHASLKAGNIPPLLGERRDVILQGGCILAYMMGGLHMERLLPLDRDGLEGYAMYLAEQGRL